MFESLFKAASEEKKKPEEDKVKHQKKKVKKRKRGNKKPKNETSPRKEKMEIKTRQKPTSTDRINSNDRKTYPRKQKAPSQEPDRVNSNDRKTYPRKQKAPSQEALELSAKLKQLCQQKNLSEAIRIFNAPSNKTLLDGHHLCIMVDLYGRCGNIAQGQLLVDNWNGPINIQTKTALMKGYCHCGNLEKAEELYRDMISCGKSNRHERPNVRTLNTLLRGCLWAAVGINQEKKKYKMSGGVVTADSIWPSKTKGTGKPFIIPDLSSYEYYISLLCQSLRCDDASLILNDFIEKFQVKENANNRSYTASDPNALETLAISYYNLSKAYVLLGQFAKAKTCTDKVKHISSSLRNMSKSSNGSMNQSKKMQGGKRAWRQDEISDRRIVSNSLFREHKLSELETNTKALQEIMSRSHNSKNFDAKHYARENAREMLRKVLYFSGGGTTDLSATNHSVLSPEAKSRDCSNIKIRLINAQWYSFGLQMLMQVAFPQEQIQSREQNPTPLSQADCSKILNLLKLDPNYVLHEDGTLNFSRVFDNRPIHGTNNLNIELGSGFGEFAINQALANPNDYYLATEMRSDRVGQMNTLNILSSLHNLASIGTECGNFLKYRIQEGSINTIYCNHPEPPTQTFGANNSLLKLIASGKAEEPAHMLNSKTLLSAGLCLCKDNGRLVIVTDNRWYANLICSSLLLVMKDRPHFFHQVPLTFDQGFTKLETFFGSSHSSIDLYEGQPSQAIGHSTRGSKGTTFFDKLWRKNAGKHADSSKRFVICVSRSASQPTETKSSKKRKRSLSRQQARNERRMKKKLEEST